jgi:hypothetical protein
VRELEPVRLTRLYVLVLGAGLLLDGGLFLLLNGLGRDSGDNLLHVVTGAALLVVSFLSRETHALRVVWAALIFGAFYVALGVVGLTVEQPFGLLQPGAGGNAFHLAVGLLAIVLGAWSLRTGSPPVALSRTAALPVRPKSVPAARRPARRRPGKVRGHQRRH